MAKIFNFSDADIAELIDAANEVAERTAPLSDLQTKAYEAQKIVSKCADDLEKAEAALEHANRTAEPELMSNAQLDVERYQEALSTARRSLANIERAALNVRNNAGSSSAALNNVTERLVKAQANASEHECLETFRNATRDLMTIYAARYERPGAAILETEFSKIFRHPDELRAALQRVSAAKSELLSLVR